MKLEIENLSIGYGSQVVISDLTYQVRRGCVTTLIGRNGSGKSTLLRSIGRLLRPAGGSILLDGKAIGRVPTRQLAQQMAILPQGHTAPEGVTVRNLVEHGRYPHRAFLGTKTDQDHRTVSWALDQTSLADVADRPLSHLSGGQQQRAWLAMALAQDTDLILLDEPTTFLDLAYQLEMMDLLRRLNRENGTTILMVLHDINQAAQYSDELVAIRGGQIFASGKPSDVVTAAIMHDVFGLDVDIIPDPRAGSPLCIPYALARSEDQPTGTSTGAAQAGGPGALARG